MNKENIQFFEFYRIKIIGGVIINSSPDLKFIFREAAKFNGSIIQRKYVDTEIDIIGWSDSFEVKHLPVIYPIY